MRSSASSTGRPNRTPGLASALHVSGAACGASAALIASSRRAPVGWPRSTVTAWLPVVSSQLSATPGAVRTTGVSGWTSRMFSISYSGVAIGTSVSASRVGSTADE